MASQIPDQGVHLSDEQLSHCPPSERSPGETAHLLACEECSGRLRAFQTALAAYAEYRDSVRAPLLPPAPMPWRPMRQLIEADRADRRQPPRRWLWLTAAAAACACTLLILVARRPAEQAAEQASAQASDLLVRSASLPVPRSRRLTLRAGGRMLVRPAVLAAEVSDPEMARIGNLFHEARYSWRDPLSARSFQEWRGSLKHKRDSVSVIRRNGETQYYRVRTDDPEGVLQSASLALRAGDLRPTDGEFEFRGSDLISMREAPVEEASQEWNGPAAHAPAAVPAPVESPAGPEDTLRVMAALDAIDADAGEPLEVTEDAGHRHVVVHAGSVNPALQQRIARALAPLPHVVVDLESAGSRVQPADAAPPETYSSKIPEALRQRFEQRLGGAVAVQETTDRVLDAGASLVARIHALEVLAAKFPPPIEAGFSNADRLVLRGLRRRHLAELRKSAAQIRASLQPLLENPAVRLAQGENDGRTWQAGVPEMAASARDLDRLLNRLLAGDYSQASGEEMLRELGPLLDRFDASLQSKANWD
jgi:hypothetical protein